MIIMNECFKEVYLVAVDEHPYVFFNLWDAIDFLDYVIMLYVDYATISFKKSKGISEDSFDYDEMYHTPLYKTWESYVDFPL